MLRLFSPRKTTLMFVIRDKTRTPLENLEPVLREDIQKIWDSVPKPEAHKHTPLSEFFNVQVVALSSYEEKEEQFKEQVASLRQKFFQSIAPGGLAGDRRGVVPASGFSFSTQQIWEVIKENKDLDLPAHKVMVATVRCEEIANEKYSSFVSNEDWLELEEVVQSHLVPGFGKKLCSLLYNCLYSYEEEATYFEDSVRSAKRKQLEEKLLQLVQPAYQLMLEHIRSETLNNFKKALTDALNGGQGFAVAVRDCTTKFITLFDEQCQDADVKHANWDSVKVRAKFSSDLDSHIAEVRTTKLSELTSLYESKLKEALYGPVESLLEGANDDTWPAIRKLFSRVTETTVSEFSFALSGFELDEQEKEDMVSKLENFARGLVEGKTREEAAKVLYHMKERFTSIFNHDNDSMPRVWTGKEDIRTITKTARSSSLKLLSVLAAIRLDEETDTIGDTLVLALVDPKKNNSKSTTDPLASSTWKEVPATKTLISPVQCKTLWNQFQRETEYTITQAIASQEANKRNNNWLPPPWAIAAMVILGFNEFMTLLRNPLWLLLIFVSYLLLKALWVQLDISGEFRNGALPGILSLTTKFLPTVTNLLRKLAEEGQTPVNNNASRNNSDFPQQSRTFEGNNSGVSSTASSEVIMGNGMEYTSPQK
ncbi:hypothetical protein R6Q59_028740 [Mikania micrantha]